MEITVHSIIDNLDDSGLPTDEPEINIITAPCTLSEDGGTLVMTYREKSDAGCVDVTLALGEDGTVSLSRTGSVIWNAKFKEGVRSGTLYQVPPYSFDAEVYTKKIRTERTDGVNIQLIYSMDIGGQKKNVRMKITVKG